MAERVPGAGRMLLQARGLTKHFGPVAAVHDLDLAVAEGSVHALVGPPGAGKTTVLNLVSGYLAPDSGRVLVRGQDVTGWDPARLELLGVGRCFAIAGLFDEVRVSDYLQRVVGASRSQVGAGALPAVLDGVGLGARAGALIGALGVVERRMLEVAVALATDPRLLILDEPSAGLDAAEVDRLVQFLAHGRAGRAVLVADPNLRLVSAIADRVTVLRAGRLVAHGSYPQVRHEASLLAAARRAAD